MKPNSKRERSWSAQSLRFVFTGARGLAAVRSRFDRQTRSARTPPYPPTGERSRFARVGKSKRARFRFALEVRDGRSRAIGTTWPKTAAEARGNSGESIQSLFRLSGFRGGRGAGPVGLWAHGRRQDASPYASVAPLAPGGVSGRLGANPKAEDSPVNDDKEVLR